MVEQNFEQDYLMRIIKEIAKLMAKVILHKETAGIDPSNENEQTENYFLYKRLVNLADNGKINEAENLLYDLQFFTSRN